MFSTGNKIKTFKNSKVQCSLCVSKTLGWMGWDGWKGWDGWDGLYGWDGWDGWYGWDGWDGSKIIYFRVCRQVW